MSLHPFIHLRVGGEDISSVPPEFINGITYKSSIEALSTLSVDLTDPAYTAIEDALLLSDQNKEPILARFGYFDPRTEQVVSNWIQSRLLHFTPNLTHRGNNIVFDCMVDIGTTFVDVPTKTYSGKISEVVAKIAADMGAIAEVEETNDDANTSYIDNRGSPREWTTKNMSLWDFVGKELLPIARSKTGQSNYDFFVTGVGDKPRPPVLHFHTKEFPNCQCRKKPIKELNYLAGSNDNVIEWRPDYQSISLGNIGASQVVMRAVDPITKQIVTASQNSRTNPDSQAAGSGDKVVSAPIGEEGQDDLVSQGGYATVPETDASTAEARARNRWELLKAYSYSGVLTLVGLPELSDIEANDLIRLNVLIPDPPGTIVPSPRYRLHWSSGLFFVKEAIHAINSNYMITCQLARDVGLVGSDGLKTARYVPPAQ